MSFQACPLGNDRQRRRKRVHPTPPAILPLHEIQPHGVRPLEQPHRSILRKSCPNFDRHSQAVSSRIHKCTLTWRRLLPTRVHKHRGRSTLSLAIHSNSRNRINSRHIRGSPGPQSCVHRVCDVSETDRDCDCWYFVFDISRVLGAVNEFQ